MQDDADTGGHLEAEEDGQSGFSELFRRPRYEFVMALFVDADWRDCLF